MSKFIIAMEYDKGQNNMILSLSLRPFGLKSFSKFHATKNELTTSIDGQPIAQINFSARWGISSP